jgi:hypothetical protein
MLRKQAWGNSSSQATKKDWEEEEKKVQTARADAVKVDSLTSSMSALKFVPRSVKFGKGRPGFAKH